MLFEEVYIQYTDYIEYRKKPQTRKFLKDNFEKKILPYFEGRNIYDITELDYAKWQDEIEKFNYKNSYKSNLHYIFSGFFNYCVLFHKLDHNIARRVGNFKMTNVKVEKDFYTLWEFIKFIRKMDHNIIKPFFIILYHYCTRPGEAMAFRFSDLSNDRKLTVNFSISEHCINGERIIDTPKSLDSVRSWKLSRRDYKMLMKLKQYYINKYGMKDYNYFIFGGIKPLSPTTINRYKIKACEKAKIRPLELRGFRRSGASLMYHLNVPLAIIKEWLGHADERTTSKYYIMPYESKRKRVTRTLNLTRLLF